MKIKSLATFFKSPTQRALSSAEQPEESQVTVKSSQEAPCVAAATQLEEVQETGNSLPEESVGAGDRADSSKPDSQNLDKKSCNPSPGRRAAEEAVLSALEQEAVWQSTLLAGEVWLSPRPV